MSILEYCRFSECLTDDDNDSSNNSVITMVVVAVEKVKMIMEVQETTMVLDLWQW